MTDTYWISVMAQPLCWVLGILVNETDYEKEQQSIFWSTFLARLSVSGEKHLFWLLLPFFKSLHPNCIAQYFSPWYLAGMKERK